MPLQTNIKTTDGWKGEYFEAEQASGKLGGHAIKQLVRGIAVLGGVAGAALGGLAIFGRRVEKAFDSTEGEYVGRRLQAVPEVTVGIPTQSVFPGTGFSLPFSANTLFKDTDSAGFTLKANEKGKLALPSWMNLDRGDVNLLGSKSAGTAFGVHVVGHFAYMASSSNGLNIIDVGNPNSPIKLGNYNTPGTASDVYVVENLAYVADGSSGLQIVDVSTPSAPSQVSNYDTPGTASSVYVKDNVAYVADGVAGLLMINVTNSSIPSLEGTFSTLGSALDVQVVGSLAYVADGNDDALLIIDISNSSTPFLMGRYDTSMPVRTVHIVDGLAHVVVWSTGLRIIDVSNPSAPTLVGSYNTPGAPADAYRLGDYVYMTDSSNGLGIAAVQILDVKNPSNPTVAGSFFLPDQAKGLQGVGNFIYLAGRDAGLKIIEHEGLFLGTPNQTHIGNYKIELIAEDTDYNQASIAFDLRVEGAPLVAGSISNRLANVGAIFSYFIDQGVFPDPNGDVVFYSSKQIDQSPLPSWLSFSSIGIFSGTPRSSDVGTYSIEVSAFDGIVLDRATTNFNLTVEHFPEVTDSLPNQAADFDRLYSYTVPLAAFTDQDVGDTLTYTATLSNGTPLPTWLSFNPTSRQFSGTPTVSNAGTLTIKVSATDIPGAVASTSFRLEVEDFPDLLNSIPDQLAAVGLPYIYKVPGNTFSTPNGDPLTFRATKADGSFLPAWLGFVGPRLEFQGTPLPTDKGTVSLKVIAEDPKGGTAEAAFDLGVVNALSQEIARVGGAFVYIVPNDMIASPLGPVTYTVTLGDGSPLPIWMTYNPSTNVISGTPPPNSEGSYSILVTADDSVQTPVQGTVSLSIGANAAPQVANPLSNQVAQVGQRFRFVVPDNTFVDTNGDTLTLGARKANNRPLPNWLSFGDRTLEGKPGRGNTGDFSDNTIPLQICATDGDQEACSAFDLSVQGTSNAELFFSVAGPLLGVGGIAVAWYKKRGVFLNPWNRENYDKRTVVVSIGAPFTYKLDAPQDKIKEVRAFKGRRMLAGLPAPKALDEKGWLEWLKHDKPITGGNLLPSWLTYNEGKNQLTSQQGPQQEDEGTYVVRAYGHGEVILGEVKLKVGGQDVEMVAF